MTDDRQRADESIASRFTRLMNATTSPVGMITDPPLVAAATAVLLIAFLAALNMAGGPLATALGVLAATPFAAALLVSVALLGARRRVVDWLSSVPFPVENMNAILNGLGETLEVTLAGGDGARPTTPELNAELDAVNPDAFVTKFEEGDSAIEIRIGVVDSKRNPARSNHQRFVRVKEIVERVLVPLSKKCPIAVVRVR
jgi:hypothetical protein